MKTTILAGFALAAAFVEGALQGKVEGLPDAPRVGA